MLFKKTLFLNLYKCVILNIVLPESSLLLLTSSHSFLSYCCHKQLASCPLRKPGIYPKNCQDLFSHLIFELNILDSSHFSSKVNSSDRWLCFLLCLRFPNGYASYSIYSQGLPGMRRAEVASQNLLFVAWFWILKWAMRFSCDTLCLSSLFCRTICHPVT